MASQLGLNLPSREDELRQAELLPTKAARTRATRLAETRHDLLSALPSAEDLMFNHSGLCQTSLPHFRPKTNSAVWKRHSGRFTLMVRPGVIDTSRIKAGGDSGGHQGDDADYVGVPFGSKARLIMFHLQSEGLKSRTVALGKNLSAYLRSLGLDVRGGPRGTIQPIKEQALKIGRCTFTMQWDEEGGNRLVIHDTSIVEGMELSNLVSDDWSGSVQLSQKFYDHLREHAVPLDKRGIAMLSNNSIALDLYALFAHRLPRLSHDVKLTWEQLNNQIGGEGEAKELSRMVRKVLPNVLAAYPGARIEVETGSRGRAGKLVLKPSPAAVPKTMVGHRLVSI